MPAKSLRLFTALLSLCIAIAIPVSANNLSQHTQKVHVVKEGETVYAISRTYGVSVDELFSLNPSAQDGITIGEKLLIPQRNLDNQSSPKRQKYRYHPVRGGDTLYSIAKSYGVTVDEILEANSSLKSAQSLPGGIILRIPPRSNQGSNSNTSQVKTTYPTTPPVSPTEKVTGLKVLEVAPGMTMYSLLRMTGWTEGDLLKYNPALRNGLKAGMNIFVPDIKLPNNKAVTNATPMALPSDQTLDSSTAPNIISSVTVVLGLPFSEDGSNNRFRDYYQGFLLKLKEVKEKGISVNLHTVDISNQTLSRSISELEALPSIDWIIGGVSESSRKALAGIAQAKGALYTIPFTSLPLKGISKYSNTPPLNVYQINTPHDRLYAATADKFVQVYGDGKSHVHLVNFATGGSYDKSVFLTELKQTLSRYGIPYSEGNGSNLANDLSFLKGSKSGKIVVVPSSSSRTDAEQLLRTIATISKPTSEQSVDSVTDITAFGYPEWQTYGSRLRTISGRPEYTFYATFFTEPSSNDYKSFQQDYISWYGINVGNTYPRYSILGYDTAGYFLDPSSSGNIYKNGRYDGVYDGIQSRFIFRSSSMAPNVRSNMGVFFVRFPSHSSGAIKL